MTVTECADEGRREVGVGGGAGGRQVSRGIRKDPRSRREKLKGERRVWGLEVVGAIRVGEGKGGRLSLWWSQAQKINNKNEETGEKKVGEKKKCE